MRSIVEVVLLNGKRTKKNFQLSKEVMRLAKVFLIFALGEVSLNKPKAKACIANLYGSNIVSAFGLLNGF